MSETIQFDKKGHHFFVTSQREPKPNELKLPLSVTLQVTRNCNMNCVYCSEISGIADPSVANIRAMLTNLKGVKRIILSGGEPLVRDDIAEILELTKEQAFELVSLATNGTLIRSQTARKLVDLVDYVDVTIDGPREVHNKIRGEYDAVLLGIKALREAGIPFSLVTVLFRQNVDSIFYVCQIADALEAKKLKVMTPIAKGRGKNIVSERLSSAELLNVFRKIQLEKEKNGWSPRITLIDWNKVGEGHAILVQPDGEVVASPVPSVEDCVHPIGNIVVQKIELIWRTYPYKRNHLNKYTEGSLYVC